MIESGFRLQKRSSRAQSLFAGLGVALGGLSTAAHAQPRPVAAPVQDALPEGLDRLQAIMTNNDVTILGDSNHTLDRQTYALLSDPKILNAMQQANVGTVAVEMPNQLQGAVDKLAAGKSTRQQFKDTLTLEGYVPLWQGSSPDKWYDILADGVQAIARRGIKFICADQVVTPQATKLMDFEAAHVDELTQIIQAKGTDQERLRNTFNKKYGKQQNDLLADLAQSRISQPFNTALAKGIEDSATKGKHIAVLFGEGHAAKLELAFQNMGKRAAMIAVHPDKDALDMAKLNTALIGLGNINYDRMNNFLLDTQRFSDDPPAPAKATYAPSTAASRTAKQTHR